MPGYNEALLCFLYNISDAKWTRTKNELLCLRLKICLVILQVSKPLLDLCSSGFNSATTAFHFALDYICHNFWRIQLVYTQCMAYWRNIQHFGPGFQMSFRDVVQVCRCQVSHQVYVLLTYTDICPSTLGDLNVTSAHSLASCSSIAFVADIQAQSFALPDLPLSKCET